MFSFGQIALSTGVGAVVSFLVVWLDGRWAKEAALTASQAVVVAVLAGLSILVWRLPGNTPPLNEDPIPLVSPNDVLCPVLTYVILGMYADVTAPSIDPAGGACGQFHFSVDGTNVYAYNRRWQAAHARTEDGSTVEWRGVMRLGRTDGPPG